MRNAAARLYLRIPVAVKGLSDWKCRYDLKTGKFDVPAMFAKENTKALNWEIRR